MALGDASLSGKVEHSSVIDRFYLPGNLNGNYVYLGWTNVIKNHSSHRRFLLSCPYDCEWPVVKIIAQLSGATAECCEDKMSSSAFKVYNGVYCV